MIDTLKEKVIPLNQVPDHLPRTPRGNPIHIASVYRWADAGVRGVILETIAIGGSRYTSVEAISRFVAATTEAMQTGAITPAKQAQLAMAREAQARKRSEKAEARLKAMGA